MDVGGEKWFFGEKFFFGGESRCFVGEKVVWCVESVVLF